MSIESEITRLSTAKADLKTAIENKGVTVPSDATLDDYAGYVDAISTGERDWYVDEDLKYHGDVVINVTSIGQKQFENQTHITSLHFTAEEGITFAQYAFRYSSAVSKILIDKLVSIGGEAFSYCGFSELAFKNAEGSTIGGYICRQANSATVKINGTPTTLSANAFKYSYITNLYVSWSEGDVENAPWEATRATVYYDTVFDENMDVVSYSHAVSPASANSLSNGLLSSGFNNDDEEEEVTE